MILLNRFCARFSVLPVGAGLGLLLTAGLAAAPQQTLPGLPAVPPAVRPRSSAPRPRVEQTPAMPADSPVAPAVEAWRRGDDQTAARLLSALDPAEMPAPEARRWRLTAQSAAVRTGNRALLHRVNQGGEQSLFADGRQILHAWELAQVGRYDLARARLKRVGDPDKLDERSRRRYLTLMADMAHQEGNRKEERAYLTHLVDYVGAWQTDNCQSCHARPEKYGDDVTSLRVWDLWIGRRYSEMLRRDGNAHVIRAQSEAKLVRDQSDDAARLRLGWALRAEGRDKDAETTLRGLHFAAFPDRPFKQPDNDITFPGALPIKNPRLVTSFMPDNHIVSASDYLKAEKFADARRELRDATGYGPLSPRQKIRAQAVRARLARLEGKAGEERDALITLLRLGAALPRVSGMSGGVEGAWAEWQTWWPVRRMAEALRETGEAQSDSSDTADFLLRVARHLAAGRTAEALKEATQAGAVPLSENTLTRSDLNYP